MQRIDKINKVQGDWLVGKAVVCVDDNGNPFHVGIVSAVERYLSGGAGVYHLDLGADDIYLGRDDGFRILVNDIPDNWDEMGRQKPLAEPMTTTDPVVVRFTADPYKLSGGTAVFEIGPPESPADRVFRLEAELAAAKDALNRDGAPEGATWGRDDCGTFLERGGEIVGWDDGVFWAVDDYGDCINVSPDLVFAWVDRVRALGETDL